MEYYKKFWLIQDLENRWVILATNAYNEPKYIAMFLEPFKGIAEETIKHLNERMGK